MTCRVSQLSYIVLSMAHSAPSQILPREEGAREVAVLMEIKGSETDIVEYVKKIVFRTCQAL